MCRELKPPAPLDALDLSRSLFLAGSIEMGTAGDWQAEVVQVLQQQDVLILNPRRAEWDSSWKQSISNPQFREQVEWELTAQERATWIAMYFDPQTKAPVTLLELGLFARSNKTIVCCPDGYWRKGNVEITCHRYGVPIMDSFEGLIREIIERIEA